MATSSAPAPAAGSAALTRLLVYNLRYGAGTGVAFNLPVPGAGYLRRTRRRLLRIARLVEDAAPDLLALVEVDLGSWRAGDCQARTLAAAAGHPDVVRACKYAAGSLLRRLPLLRHQGNAFTGRGIRAQRVHFLSVGSKRLVIEVHLAQFVVFVVHLAVGHAQRRRQLDELVPLVRGAPLPAIVTGDFNTFRGTDELVPFLDATGLRAASTDALPTYPSLGPRRQLDHVLVSPAIRVRAVHTLPARHSDHLPLLCDFVVEGAAARPPGRRPATPARVGAAPGVDVRTTGRDGYTFRPTPG